MKIESIEKAQKKSTKKNNSELEEEALCVVCMADTDVAARETCHTCGKKPMCRACWTEWQNNAPWDRRGQCQKCFGPFRAP
jgi:hypothetical protein